MRNKTLMLLVSMMLAFMSLSAQELAVKSFTHVPNDLSAQTNERLDLNGKPCALLKISVMDNIINATGSIVGNIEHKHMTKWIYTTSRAPQIKLDFQYHYPLTIKFADYGYQYLDGYQTYEVVLVEGGKTSEEKPVGTVVTIDTSESDVKGRGTKIYYPETNGNGLRPPRNISNPVIRRLVENMVHVEGGTFTMGATSEQGTNVSDDEKPAFRVKLNDFYIGKYEVTQEEWEAVMGSNPSKTKGPKLPVEQVRWKDCQMFIIKLNDMTGLKFRLPTEAEWEYAARGGNRSIGFRYSGSDDIGNIAWYKKNSRLQSKPTGAKASNELGLHDMSGSVWEWCNDWYGRYNGDFKENPQGPAYGQDKVYRGGCLYDEEWFCRITYRKHYPTTGRSFALGLRLAL